MCPRVPNRRWRQHVTLVLLLKSTSLTISATDFPQRKMIVFTNEDR